MKGESDLQYLLWMTEIAAFAPQKGVRLMEVFGSAKAVWEATEKQIGACIKLEDGELKRLKNRSLAVPNLILARCKFQNIRLLPIWEEDYPDRLRNIYDPPLVLYIRGKWPDFNRLPAVAVVGQRKATAYGIITTERLAFQLSLAGVIVVSGMAVGIDSAAHNGAVKGNTPTVAVFGTAIDQCYPAKNAGLLRSILYAGAAVSEYPPGKKTWASDFPKRNRIISGLSLGVVVGEAPAKSGSLITAGLALDQGRDVFVVPGNIHVATCEGSNQLMREGAAPVSCGWDVLSEYESLFPDKIRNVPAEQTASFRPLKHLNSAPNTPGKTGENRADKKKENNLKKEIDKKGIDKEQSAPYSDVNDILPKLSPQERIIVTALKDGPRLVDDVIAETGLTTGKVLGILTMLELKKVIRRHPGKRISLI